jgi:hypothetical protein
MAEQGMSASGLSGQPVMGKDENNVLRMLRVTEGGSVGTGAAGVSYTLLTAASATGTASTIVAGNYTWKVWGTWDGATATLQTSPDGGTTWIDQDDCVETANGGRRDLNLDADQYRVAISGAGGSTSLSSKLGGVA